MNPEKLTRDAKLTKTGNSLSFRILKPERQFMNIDEHSKFKTKVSPDGKEITFTKVDDVSDTVKSLFEKTYAKNKETMKVLKDL